MAQKYFRCIGAVPCRGTPAEYPRGKPKPPVIPYKTTMSQSDTTPVQEQEVNKTVTLVGYPSVGQFSSPRGWAHEMDDKRDYFERYHRTRENTEYYIVANGEKIEITEEQFHELEGIDSGDMSVVCETEEEVRKGFENSPKRAAKDFANEVINDNNLDGLDGYKYTRWGRRWDEEDGDTRISIYSYIEEMPLLVHQEEMTADNKYESEEDRVALKYKVKITGATPEQVEMIEEEIIKPFNAALAQHPDIERTRLADCEQKTTEKGACFNL